MKNTAKFLKRLKKWTCPAALFEVDPPIENDRTQIIIAAGNAITYYSMTVYVVYNKDRRSIHRYETIRSSTPQFKNTLKRLGYNMVNEITRFPRTPKRIAK